MGNISKNPILVTGAHRSGSTFAGRMLAQPYSVGYIHEPFNKDFGIKGIEKWFLYVKKGMKDEIKYYNLISSIMSGKAVYTRKPLFRDNNNYFKTIVRLLFRSKENLYYMYAKYNPLIRRYLIKDPIASMSSEYLHREFNMDVIVLIRHPAAFVGSIKRLNWQFNFNEFYSQTDLMEDHLNQVLEGWKIDDLSKIEQAALLWKCIYKVLFCYIQRNKRIVGIKHESLSIEPLKVFKQIYETLDLSFNERIESKIASYTRSSNPIDPEHNAITSLKRDSRKNVKLWKKILSDKEVRAIRRITDELALQYYSDDDW